MNVVLPFLLLILLLAVIFFWPLLVRLICNKLLSRLSFFRFRMSLEHVIILYSIYLFLHIFLLSCMFCQFMGYVDFGI